jgi:hypothetical protein
VYAASGISKLIDPDWFGGTVTWHRLVLVRHRLEASVLPSWAVDVLTDRSFHTYASKIVIATELFIAFGLWWRRTRYAAVWVAICFHVAIQLSAEVQVFSYLAISALVIWAVPSTRDRALAIDPEIASQRRLGRIVSRLDWLGRLRIEHRPGLDQPRLVDRDGAVRAGPAAIRLAFSRMPVTAWFALPTLLLPSSRPSTDTGESR